MLGISVGKMKALTVTVILIGTGRHAFFIKCVRIIVKYFS
jgi:hypothetical protein